MPATKKPKKTSTPKAAPKVPREREASGGSVLSKRLEAIEKKLVAVLELLEKGATAVKPVSQPRAAASPTFGAPAEPGNADTAQFLSRTALFANLSPQECAILASYCETKQVDAGQVVFSEGDFGDAMYVVKQGALNILKQDVLGDVRIAEIRPGGLVGEMALVDGKPRSANVRASEPTRLLSLSRASYHDLKKTHASVATKFQDELLLFISSRLRQTTETLVGK
jgi:CRP/FNR family transcriptional regulator, cyclic AMP receptor protein